VTVYHFSFRAPDRRYLDFEKSGLTVQIPAPRDEVSIELDTK